MQKCSLSHTRSQAVIAEPDANGHVVSGRPIAYRSPARRQQQGRSAETPDDGDQERGHTRRIEDPDDMVEGVAPGTDASEPEPGRHQGEYVLVTLTRPEDEEAVAQMVRDDSAPPSPGHPAAASE